MTGDDTLDGNSPVWVNTAYVVFIRTIAFALLLGTLFHWAQLIGLSGQGALRFDRLGTEMRIAHCVLALALPFGALGLWFMSSWGIVVALSCALLQIAMHGYWSDIFGPNLVLLVAIVLCAAVLAVFTIYFFFQWRRRRLSGY